MIVEVYRNLHKNCLSVRHKGKVIDHADVVHLTDVKFVVRPAGHAKVIATGHKNVHAFAKGTLVDASGINGPFRTVTYNPYKMNSFFDAGTLSPVTSSPCATVTPQGIQIPV